MGFLRPKAPKIPPPPPAPPPPPVQPMDPVYGTKEEDRTKRKLLDPSRVGRRQTILTPTTGLLAPETRRKRLGSGDTSKDT